MARFVSFKTAPRPMDEVQGPPFVVLNPDYVVAFEPTGTGDQPKCRVWLAIPGGFRREDVNFYDVQGSLKEVGQRLMDAPAPAPAPTPVGDPLGTHRPR